MSLVFANIQGTVTENWIGKIQFDFGKAGGDDEVAVKDAYLRYSGFANEGLRLTLGNQKPPFSREFLRSSKRQQLVERSFAGDHNFGSPDRMIGLRLDGSAASTGYIVGGSGTALKSIDGGATWASLASGTIEDLQGLHFVDVATGWGVGKAGTILKTTNGGATWVPQASGTGVILHSVHFVDANRGWIVGVGGTILKTVDGGANWVADPSGTTEPLLDVHFGDAATGYAAGGNGTILKTVDFVPTIVKRAFHSDGTPIADGSTLPSGVPVKFLLYVNNLGGAISDVSLRDILDPLFLYVGGSARFDNSVASCLAPTYTVTEEATIFAAAESGAVGTDDVDGNVFSVTGVTVNVGNPNVANAPLDIAGGKVWALVFTIRLQ